MLRVCARQFPTFGSPEFLKPSIYKKLSKSKRSVLTERPSMRT